ncbi:uncharacterized protein ColSpa_01863 [Colletotrichum spaethianum]|uniref:Heterokaryon incompatibility domain-containing protein n=1 Tax=Colletotrichum spaethianum TaxID=700344 RepID=A0AA37LCB5_9PEZI|nr:uncharacterized protein ColSpa_01863 [Colletotrichum spaethianum]GKT41682.1 hypothetical protein ColSpa_01863 [Colletotrichum spaethianum]
MSSSSDDTRISAAEPSMKPTDFYKPLEAGEIRLVRLFSGQWDDVITCDIQHWPLRESPRYYALSYARDNLYEDTKIVVNGQDSCVGEGLYEALRQFRQMLSNADSISAPSFADKTFESFWIWADYLCLDQLNEKKKEREIPRMGEIYGRAERVLGWLGENEKTEDESVKLLMKLCSIEAPVMEEP